MIKKIRILTLGLISLPLFIWTSCKDETYDQMLVEQQRAIDSIGNTADGKFSKIGTGKFETIMYEGCEYLIFKEMLDSNTEMGFMAHKGNCRNPIHNL